MVKFFLNMKAAAMDLLFPPACASCGMRFRPGGTHALCPDCRDRIRFLREPLCPVCGIEQQRADEDLGHICGACLSRPPAYDLARSLVRYETVVRRLIHRLKYGGDTVVAGALKEIAENGDLSAFDDCQLILPVPLHLQRLRVRGLNQAGVLARLLFSGWERKICPDGLIRTRNTVPQTELRGADRRKNLKEAFQVNGSLPVAGAIVCLVDDVFTTGTTLEECSRVLKSHGARKVKAITLARVVRRSTGGGL